MSRKRFKGGGGKFVQLYHSYLAEWSRLGLSCGARSLLVELIRRYNTHNNGRIYLPTREAARALGVSRNTVGNYFRELEACGFIVETRGAALGVEGKGRAAEWRLTHLSCDGKPPSAEYRKTEPRLKNRATPARKPCQGRKLGANRLAQKLCQGARISLHENPANLTSSHRQRDLTPADMSGFMSEKRGLCGLAGAVLQ